MQQTNRSHTRLLGKCHKLDQGNADVLTKKKQTSNNCHHNTTRLHKKIAANSSSSNITHIFCNNSNIARPQKQTIFFVVHRGTSYTEHHFVSCALLHTSKTTTKNVTRRQPSKGGGRPSITHRHLQSTRPVLGVLVLPGPLLQRPRHPGCPPHDVQPHHAVGLVRERAVNGLWHIKKKTKITRF